MDELHGLAIDARADVQETIEASAITVGPMLFDVILEYQAAWARAAVHTITWLVTR